MQRQRQHRSEDRPLERRPSQDRHPRVARLRGPPRRPDHGRRPRREADPLHRRADRRQRRAGRADPRGRRAAARPRRSSSSRARARPSTTRLQGADRGDRADARRDQARRPNIASPLDGTGGGDLRGRPLGVRRVRGRGQREERRRRTSRPATPRSTGLQARAPRVQRRAVRRRQRQQGAQRDPRRRTSARRACSRCRSRC